MFLFQIREAALLVEWTELNVYSALPIGGSQHRYTVEVNTDMPWQSTLSLWTIDNTQHNVQSHHRYVFLEAGLSSLRQPATLSQRDSVGFFNITKTPVIIYHCLNIIFPYFKCYMT